MEKVTDAGKLLKTWDKIDFSKEKVREVQNEIIDRFNQYTKGGECITIGVQVIYKNRTEKTDWVFIPKGNYQNILAIRIFSFVQEPVLMN